MLLSLTMMKYSIGALLPDQEFREELTQNWSYRAINLSSFRIEWHKKASSMFQEYKYLHSYWTITSKLLRQQKGREKQTLNMAHVNTLGKTIAYSIY